MNSEEENPYECYTWEALELLQDTYRKQIAEIRFDIIPMFRKKSAELKLKRKKVIDAQGSKKQPKKAITEITRRVQQRHKMEAELLQDRLG